MPGGNFLKTLAIFLTVLNIALPRAQAENCDRFMADLALELKSANFDYMQTLRTVTDQFGYFPPLLLRYLATQTSPANPVDYLPTHAQSLTLRREFGKILTRTVDWPALQKDILVYADEKQKRGEIFSPLLPPDRQFKLVEKLSLPLPEQNPLSSLPLQFSGEDAFYSSQGRPVGLFAAPPFQLTVFDALNGHLLKTLKVDNPAPDYAHLINLHGDPLVALMSESHLKMQDALTGVTLWERPYPDLKSFFLRSFSTHDKVTLLVRDPDSLLLLDSATGSLVRRIPLRVNASDPKLFSFGETLHFALTATGAYLEILDLSGEKIFPDIKWSEEIQFPPQLVQYKDRLVVIFGGASGVLEAIDVQSHESLGRIEAKGYPPGVGADAFFHKDATTDAPDLQQFLPLTNRNALTVAVNSRWGATYLVDLLKGVVISQRQTSATLYAQSILPLHSAAQAYAIGIFTHDPAPREKSKIEIMDMATGEIHDQLEITGDSINRARLMHDGKNIYLNLTSIHDTHVIQLFGP